MDRREGWTLRRDLLPDDPKKIRCLIESTGYFSPAEIEIAWELACETLEKGDKAGYHFLIAEQRAELNGYSCFGPIPCTRSSYDLYWIAVAPLLQGRGIGRWLVEETEQHIAGLGGTRIYVDTSSRDQYLPTRRFYEHCGYRTAAVLRDFYAPGDDKCVYLKELPSSMSAP